MFNLNIKTLGVAALAGIGGGVVAGFGAAVGLASPATVWPALAICAAMLLPSADETRAVGQQLAAAGVPALSGRAEERFAAALAIAAKAQPFDSAAAEVHLARVLTAAAGRAESV